MVSNFPFAGNSNYRKEYTPKKSFVVRNLVKDNLKTGDSWLGNTTYKTNFNKPEESYVNTWVSKEMVMNDRNFDHQYGKLVFTQRRRTETISLRIVRPSAQRK